MSTLVYKYGLLPPHTNAELVAEQIRAGHDYRNALVALENERRTAIAQIQHAYADIADLEQQCRVLKVHETGMKEAAAADRVARKSRSASPAHAAALKSAREALHVARAKLSARRKAFFADEAVQTEIAALNATYIDKGKALYNASPAVWGTRLQIVRAWEQSRKDTPFYEPLRFCRWTGDGLLAVQLQNGLPAPALFEGNGTKGFVEIDPVDPRAFVDPTMPRAERLGRHKRRKLCRSHLRLRVGSEGRTPIWAEWQILFHRPLPPGARVLWAVVHRRRVGPRAVWSVDLTVEVPDAPVRSPGPAVALNFGWRTFRDGSVRVAYWYDSLGNHGELRLQNVPTEGARHSLVSALHKSDELRATRDANRNAMRDVLLPWLRERRDALPDWLREATTAIHLWRRSRRFAQLERSWANRRFEGDGDMYDRLAGWARQDLHLWKWEAFQRRGALGRRSDLYRRFANALSKWYVGVYIQDFSLRDVAERPPPGVSESAREERARAKRHRSAVSSLRLDIVRAMERDGGFVVKVPSEHNTLRCHACGEVCAFDAAVSVEHTCEHCGATWDQDYNCSVNIYRRGERFADPTSALTARAGEIAHKSTHKRESRWSKRKREKREKASSQEGAREALADVAE